MASALPHLDFQSTGEWKTTSSASASANACVSRSWTKVCHFASPSFLKSIWVTMGHSLHSRSLRLCHYAHCCIEPPREHSAKRDGRQARGLWSEGSRRRLQAKAPGEGSRRRLQAKAESLHICCEKRTRDPNSC